MLDYHPLHSPLELPVQKLHARCALARPFALPPREGGTPGTTLAGCFTQNLWKALCPLPAGECHRKADQSEPACQGAAGCAAHWLYKPYSSVQRKTFSRPVLLFSPQLENLEPVTAFDLDITLWGRQAIAAASSVGRVLQAMGRAGLQVEGVSVPFQVETLEAGECLTLAQRLARLPPVERLLLEFRTPFIYTRRDGEGKRWGYHESAGLPLADMLGNLAYDWAAWDLEDRQDENGLDGRACHGLACDARDAARSAAAKVTVERSRLDRVDLGQRWSRSNRQEYGVRGFVGLAELGGDLGPALPWLLALSLAGGGQKRAMGFGMVKMWLGGEP